jgi:hypothetical protein
MPRRVSRLENPIPDGTVNKTEELAKGTEILEYALNVLSANLQFLGREGMQCAPELG